MRPLAFEDDLAQRIADIEPSMLFAGSTPEELRVWQSAFRAKMLELMGAIPERGGLCLEWGQARDMGSYVRHKVQYQTEPGVAVPAYILVPKGLEGPAPGVLCIHGHGRFGKDSVAGVDDMPEQRAEVGNFNYGIAARLAGRGYVALAPDLRGFGERRQGYPGPRVDTCTRSYLSATLLGTTVIALQLCDLFAAVDVLQSLDSVDGGRIACAGLSYGGRMTMMISAFDERIGFAIPSGSMNLFQERFQGGGSCGAQIFPGLLLYGDTPEIFSLIAPRPMAIEIGLQDPLIPHEWAEEGLRRIRRAYQAAGAEDRLVVDRVDCGHEFIGGLSFDMLDRWRDDPCAAG